TLVTGLSPGAAVLLLMPFVPESGVWKRRKQEGTLKRPSFGALFSPELRRTTIVTTLLSACGYAAAFGAIQMTPLNIVPGLPDMAATTAEAKSALQAAEARAKAAKDASKDEQAQAQKQLQEAKEGQRHAAQAVRARSGT